MKRPQFPTLKTVTSLVLLLLLTFAGSASAALTVTVDNQTGATPFTPTWVVPTDSLIAGLTPTTTNGNFSRESTGRNLAGLTAGSNLTINFITNTPAIDGAATSASTNYVTCGNGGSAGSLLVYTLPNNANGYDLTNITIFSGWVNGGRDGQAYTILYATKANPTNFVWLGNVLNNGSGTALATANRATITDSSGGVLAANVVAVAFDFSSPNSENGYVGYAAITVEGTVAATVMNPVVSISTENQTGSSPFTPSFVAESPNLIGGIAPSTANGNFVQEGSGGTPVLTDGAIGVSGSVAGFATCGTSGGNTLIYPVTSSPNGSDITNIIVYSGWGDRGRDGQYFSISYSTVAAPTTYLPITTVYYNPQIAAGIASANRVAINTSTGAPLAGAVANLKFDFSNPPSASSFDNAYSGYSEIVVQGNDTAAPPPPPSPFLTQDTLPSYVETFVGDRVTFVAAFSNTPPASLQWQFISTNNAVTNNIPGATSTNLMIASAQLTNSGFYRLKAVNATNGSAAPSYSASSQLVVSNLPAAVNGIVIATTGQRGLGVNDINTNFYPTWSVDTSSDLIFGFVSGSGPGTFAAGPGNYGFWGNTSADPTILMDGSSGYLSYWPNVGASPTESVVGGGAGTGESMTYTLDYFTSATNGFDLTNITVYGGWGDGGRDAQKYEVLYSTPVAPDNFFHLVTVDYNPVGVPANTQSATRTILTPSTTDGLVKNVAKIQFKFNIAPENGSVGVSEITVAGKPSAPAPLLTQDIAPATAVTVAGDQITLSAAFSGATSYQWQKDGTNITGATNPTLVLSNLATTDTATNNGYRLLAFNGTAFSASSASALTVNPSPAAVANVITSISAQTEGGIGYSPTWTISTSDDLIYLMAPSSSSGNFNLEGDHGNRDVNSLTDGGSLEMDLLQSPATASLNYVTAGNGSGAGSSVIYTLTGSANGYNLTNISVYGGWADAGRDQQAYTAYYSTVLNPSLFLPIATVNYDPANPNGLRSVTRSVLTAVTGSLATNVAAVKIDFTNPSSENGYVGYAEITVSGFASGTAPTGPVVSGENQNTDVPTWVVETNNLIEGQAPSSVGPGSFAGGFNNEAPTEGLPALTDGTFGPFGLGNTNFATAGGAFGAGSSVTFTSANGWNLTNIIVYSGWGNYDRDGQFYTIKYSTLSAPNTFVPLVSVGYNPPALTGPAVNRVNIALPNGGALATNVYAVTFDFTPQNGGLDNGYSGYAEIVLQGSNLAAVIRPTTHTPFVSNGNLILTSTGGPASQNYTWLTTTNLNTPLANWTVVGTGSFDGLGASSNAVPFNSAARANFYRQSVP